MILRPHKRDILYDHLTADPKGLCQCRSGHRLRLLLQHPQKSVPTHFSGHLFLSPFLFSVFLYHISILMSILS